MEGKIKKENIIFIALLYNWFANYENELEEWDVSSFIEKVREHLRSKFQMEIEMESSCNQEEEWDYYNEVIKEMFIFKYKGLSGIYELQSLEDADYIYDRQPKEVIQATLQHEALFCIHVAKENLEIKTEYKWKSERKGIYTLHGKDAQQHVREDLEKNGCRNIQIGFPTPAQLKDDVGFSVTYTCEEPIEKVNVLA